MLAANSAAVSRQILRGPGVIPPWQGSGDASVLGGMMMPPSATSAPPLPEDDEPPLPEDDEPPLPEDDEPPLPEDDEPPEPEPELEPEPEPLPPEPLPLPLPLPPVPVMMSPRPAQPAVASRAADATRRKVDRYIRPPGGDQTTGGKRRLSPTTLSFSNAKINCC